MTQGKDAAKPSAVEVGSPMFLGILGGMPESWAQYGNVHREAWVATIHSAGSADILPRRRVYDGGIAAKVLTQPIPKVRLTRKFCSDRCP
jgi:hypothetical protein